MGRYGGWGAADAPFAPGASGNDLRDQERLRAVLARLGGSAQAGGRLFNAAAMTVLNAHYTDPLLVRAMYRTLGDLGLEHGTVVEAGVGAGQFAAFAPDGIRITGIELDPATALIAQLLHPDAEILVGSVSGPRFARVRDQSANPVRVPRDTADGFAGNVPFSDIKWPDEVLNPGTRFPLHDHAILWGVTRVAPGGLCAFITSRYTADKQNPGFRRTLAAEMDLIGMVRLPSTAHKRMAGTPVVTDIIIGRRLADGERPRTDPETWEQARPLPLRGTDVTPLVNAYFHANPQHVLGTITAGGMRRADDFTIAPSGDLETQLGAALGEIAGRALAAGQRHEPRPAARPVIEILSRRPDGTLTANPDGSFTQVVHGQDTPLKIDSAREADQTRRLVAVAVALADLRKAEAACAEDTDETDAVRARLGKLYDDYTRAYGAIGRFTVRTQNYHVKTLKSVLDRLDFSKADVPDPEVTLLEAYLGRDALTRTVKSVADPGHVRHGTRKDKQGNEVPTQTQLVQVASVRAALTAALAEIPQGEDAERLTAAFGERMSRIETGEIRTRLMPVAFRSDPRRPAVESLENFDPVTQAAVKKPVFSRRTAVPHRLELGADTPEEALDLVLIHRRRVDLPEVARLLGTDEADARKKLGTLVFDDPAAGGSLVAAGEYLSGNVREKLAQARTAAAADPDRYAANVEGLQAVQPAALAAEDIQARLGSAWLSRQIVQDGLREILEDPTLTVTHPGGAAWSVSTRKERNSNAQDRYGTSDWNAVDLAEALLTNASVVVYRKRIDPQTGEEKSYRDDNATLFAYRKAQRLDADFVSWLWSDPDRADECVRLYNSAYNNQVKRRWDSSPFRIPGLAPGIRLHPFQNAMVRRLHTESGLAAWVVGAGKTELGIVAAMEGNRLGRHELAAIVCPASLVNQWRDRIYRTYPRAQVLVADDDLRARRDAREMFVERAASGDYQLAVTPYEFFGSLPLSADAARASVDEEIDKLTRYAKEAAAQGDRYTAKALQGQIARLEAQYSAVALAAGGATGFTDARITAVVVDEWHNFRRITRDSNNRAMAIIKGSDRADHMLAVFDYLRKRHPEGLVLGLSGTPLEQSIADAWAAMRFFAPERLKELGLEEFDAFLTTFGRTEARREPTPTGSGLHVRERASDWFNLPEMRRALWDPFVDVVRSADLGLNVPRLTGGRPQTHVLPQIPVQAGVQAEIDEGYARFKAGDRGPDNHILRLMDRAAKNALHPRMLGMETDGKIKLEVWADDAAAWYHATKDARFLDREGNPHPRPGALRMVACEIGVPDPARPNAWSVYSEMRSMLAARGVPADAVRFAQDAAGSDRKKAALWEDARTGRCNFVIGSAQTAGTGVDVPDRLQVLDYMTLSWNPTQFEQWLGRIVRQGNQNPEVTANVWSTEGTIEVLRADKIAMKSAPFEALLDGTSETRRVNEETYDPLSAWAAEMTARMSGNPLLNAQREAQLEVETAQGMQDEWQRENGVKARRVATMKREIGELEDANAAIGRALARAVDTRGDKFAAQVGTVRYTARAEAGAALIAVLAATAAADDVRALDDGNPQHLGDLAGFPVTARYKRYEPDPPAQAEDGQDDGPDPGPSERTWVFLGLEGVPDGQVDMMRGSDLADRDPVGLMSSLEGRIRRLPGSRDKNTAVIAENRDQIAKTKAELAKPSPYLQQLADARDALDRIEAEIDAQLAPEPDAAAPEDAEPASVAPGEAAPDAGAERAAGAATQADGDIASLPPWTADSPYSTAVTAALLAALADSNVTQIAGSNDLGRFLEWLSHTGWMSDYAAAAVGDDGQVPPFARAVLDDPVFAADLDCAVGTVVHARCAGQALPPGSAARRPIPPMVEMSALRHWQEQDEAIGRAAGTDQWYDLVDAAGIDIWLSRAGLPRAGRQVLVDSGGHAVLELAAADGGQWRLTVPNRKDTRHEATARYKVTRSGRDGWVALLNGTPGSTTPEQAAGLLVGTLTEEGAFPPAPATAVPDQATGLTPFPVPPAGDPPEGTPAPIAEDGEEGQAAGTADWPPGHPYASQRDALVAAFHSAHDGPPAAMRGDAQNRDRQNFHATFTIWGHRRLQAAALAAINDAIADSAPPPEWARAVDRDPTLAATLVGAAAAGVWRDLTAAADATGAPGPATSASTQPGVPSPVAGPAGTADGAPPAPGAPGEPHTGQAGPGSGMSREDLDFAYQHAYEFVLGTVRDPGPAQEERALDYAAWYMAAFGDRESLDDLPGHDHTWGWFADRGFPARDLAATPGGQRDQGRPGMEATAEAASPDQAASPNGQPPDAAPRPAAGIPGQDPGTAAGPVPGGPAGHAPAGTTASPSPAAAPDLVPPVTVLHGHVSEETAVEVPDYPYGSLRCTMRFWLETDRKGQVRRVHQTTNPKRPGEPRNKPHQDTYNSWAVLYRAANGHVELHATGHWGPSPALDARIRLDGTYDQLDDAERAAYDKHVDRSLKSNARGWEDWRADLASIRGQLAEHGTLPDPGQLAQARGPRLDEADAVAAVAAVAAGLSGNHAAPPAAPGHPGTTAPDPAAEENVLLPAPTPATGGPVAAQPGHGASAAPATDETAHGSHPRPPGSAENPVAGQTPPVHAGPEPPAAAGLRHLAAAHGLAADTARTGGTLTVTVHDQGRTVLLHDDINGTTATGRRLDPAEVPAYLAAYARYPQLPPRCLLDLARREPAEPAPLTLTAARETAARHELDVRVRRVGGQSYITFCEPGRAAEFPGDIAIPGLPVLSYPAGSDSARHGPCTVPVAAIDSYLAAYRENVPPAMLTVPERYEWRRRVVPLTPHLIDGSGHFIPGVRDRLRAALSAARDDRAAEARTLLAEAEALTPVTLPPEREAELTAVVRRDAASYRHTEDPAARLATASLRNLDVTARELDWVRAYIAGHPEVREHAEESGPDTGPDSDREAATGLAQQAQEASDRGDYQRALALIDEVELLRPDGRGGYETARDKVRAAMSTAARANPRDRPQPQGQAPAAGGHTETGPTAPAAEPPAADVPSARSASGTGTDEAAIASPTAAPDRDAEQRQSGDTAPEPAPPAAAEPETASPGTGQAADAPGTAAPDGPDRSGRYSGRIRVSFESGPPTVSGTDYNDDPPELREALRANGFEWRKRRQVWEYTGRRRGPGPMEAAEAVRDLVDRLDREWATPARKEFPPTPQQQAILDAFLGGKGIAVQALAGTGKTTTLVLLARALIDRSPQARIVYTAFNSAIVADARRGRFGRNVTASTMHSLARQALLQTGYAGKIEHADKGARWPEQWAEVLGIPEDAAAEARDGAVPADAVEVARLVMGTVRKFRESADGEPGRQHLPYLAGPAGSPLSETVLSYARQAWADISGTGNSRLLAAGRALRVEHDDYLKVWALSRPRIDAQVIFFDEAQDVNDVMRRVILDQPAQPVVVGDSHQSIYGFRGAIDALKDWPADIVLPLTQSWRFGPAAAEFGNLFLRSLGSKLLLEGNPARDTRLGSAPEPDAILCRTNATAVAEVFAGLESGKRTALAGGGDAIKEIAKAARDLQAGKGTKHPDLSRFTDWDEVRHYAQHDEDGKSLQVFVRLIDRHGPGGLIDMIGRLTPEGDTRNPPQLTISTAHKAKGLEWDVVRVADDFRGPVTDPETGEVTWPVPEERRLAYVAATRARKLLEPGSLTWIYDYPLPRTRAARVPASDQDHQAQADTSRQPEHAGQEREPAPQAAPTASEDSTADDAPGQQPAPAPTTAETPASDDAAANGQVPGTSGPDAGQQDPADGRDTAPAAHGQDSAGARPGNAHAELQPPAAEPDPGEDRAASPSPAAEPDGDRSPAEGEPAGAPAAGSDDGAEPEHPAAAVAARSDSGTAPGARLDGVGPPPEAGASARLRALAAQHGLTVTAEQVSPTITVTTVTDGGRFVLRHDDFLGVAAEGTRIDLDEADAYLDAWRAYPGLPALALLDWVRRGPDDAAQLSLSAARAVAEDCGLVAEPVRAAGQPFIVVRHPGLSGTVLACRPGDPAASTGPVTIPVPSIGTYLRLYQATVKPHWLAALGKRGEWASQLTAIVPYLINGTSLYSAEARRHVDAAAHAAATDDDRAVKDLLRRAWAAAGPFSPAPDREALLLRVIGDVAPRYQEITGDGPRYAAETAHASDPEWGWIYQHVRDNPDMLTEATPTHDALEQRDGGERAQAEAEGNALSAAAKAAFDAGDYPAALNLADQGETADPGRARRWEAIRGAIREKAAAAGHAPQTAIPERPAPAAAGAGEPPTQQEAAATAEPAAAGTSASTDAGPGADDGARPGELPPLAIPAGRDEGVRFLEILAARYGLRVSHVTDALKWWTVHLSALDGGAGVPVAEYKGHTGEWRGFGAGPLDPGEVAAYLAARGEGDLHDAPTGPSDPYTRIGQARFDYHRALLAYQALRETKAGRSLMETVDAEKPRPDAIALNAAYQAVSGGWKKAFAGEAEEVAGRFAAWERAARVMARNLAATGHRAGIFRAALDVFTESAGHLASRTRVTAQDPGAWARVSGGLPGSSRAAGPAPGEAAATADTPPTAVPGPASQPETPGLSSWPVAAQDASGAAQPPPASPQQPASVSPGAQAREAPSAPAPDLTNADPAAALQAMPPGGAAPQSSDPGEDTAARAEGTRTLTLGDLTGPSPDWMSAGQCEWCGKLHGGDCPAPVTAPPPGLHTDDDELTPLGAVVEDAARYLAMRDYLDPDADGGVPDWVLAELAEIAHEKPCGGPGCPVTADGFLGPSAAADHFLQRRRQEWERWVPRWSCTCGRTFKVLPERPGTAFYEITPGGTLGDLAGHVRPDARRRTVKHSGACPGCGRLFADTIAGRPVTPRADEPVLSGSQKPAPTLFDSDTAGSAAEPGHTAGQEPARANGPETPQPGNPATASPAAAASAMRPDPTTPGPQPEPLPAADPYTDPGQAQADYRKAVHDYTEMSYTKAGHTLVRDLPSLPPPATSRPDALALDAAWCAARRRSFRESFAGDAQEVAGRFTALAQAASAMARNLAAERYRAPKFRAALDTFTASATALASRTQATAQNPGAWAGVFAGSHARTRAADPAPGKPAAPGDAPPAADMAAAPPRPVPADETATDPGRDQPAVEGPVSPGAAPLRNMDLAAELDRMPGEVFARWLSMGATPAAAGDLDYQRQGEGSQATVSADGIEITVSGPDVTRHGLVTWPQAASWIDNGVTPARLGITVTASRLGAFVERHRDQLTAAGTCDPGAVAAELAQIRGTAVAAIVDAARRSRGTAVPVPPAVPGDPAWYTAVLITRPDRTAGKAENAALERLTRLRTLIREPQQAAAAEIRATLRRWIGYGLPGIVRALDDPAAVRAWISGQASRPVPGGYDNSGERWYGTSPDGPITDRNGDDGAPSCIRWEDIPAWIQPGITSSLRDRLLAAADASTAAFRRAVGAAVRQDPGAAPGEEEEKQVRQRLRQAVDAAWAAVEAAPPPSPADLDRARRDYRDWRPVQQTLFDDLPRDSANTRGGTRTAAARSGPALSAGNRRPAAEAAVPQQEPATPQHALSPAAGPAADAGRDDLQADRPDQRTSLEHDQPAALPRTAPAHPAGTTTQDPRTVGPASAGPAHGEDPEPPLTPATNSDLAIALHSMSDQELTSFLTLEKTPAGHGSLTDRRNGLPNAGANQMLNFDHSGVRITVSSRQSRRHGQISWRQVASWIDTGLTPARLGIIIGASQLGTFTNARRDQLIAAGKNGIDAAITELRHISNDAIDAALSAALGARDADAPVPPASRGKPAYRIMAMLTGPDLSATREENTALTRIAELGAALRGTQPATPADIRTAIRWWIGDSLPDYARALASPEAMRAWIRRQASGPASRPGHGTYDNGRYYSAYPEGLRTSRGSDTRIAPWILWEEIPAWIQPGLPASLHDRLAAAEPRPAPGRTRTAEPSPPAGTADPAGQSDDPLPGPLRQAVNAAWAAIEAAPPPSPADLDHARALYRVAGTVQQAVHGSPAKTGQPGRTVAPAPRPEAEPRPASPPRPAPAAHRQDELPVAAAAGMRAGTGTRPRREPAGPGQPAATTDPLTDDDIFLGISRLPAFVIGDLFHAIDTGQPLESVSRQLAPYSGERAAGEPDPGAREAVTAEPAGLRIQLDPAGSRRTGLITWRQVDELLRPGTTPARRQIVTQAWQVRLNFMAANASFRAVGEGRLAAAAEDELRAQAAAAVTAILAAAHPSADGQGPQTADEDGTVDRIADLAAALPSEPPRSRTPAGQVTTGDIIGHPGYRFQPFRVAAAPRHTDAAVEITGRLTEPRGTEPAGPITLTLPRAGRPGPFVSVIPVPARSLRPLFPRHDAAPDPGQPADARPDRASGTPAETAGAPDAEVPAPDAEAPASQPDAPQNRSQEETMPPAAHSTALPGSPASPEPGAVPQAPAAAAAPAPSETAGQRDAGRDSSGSRAADRPGDGASVTDELERVLDAIRQRGDAAADGHASDDFSDIRRAFAAMRDALGLSAASPEAGPGQPVPAPAPAPAAAASRWTRGEPGPAADGFTDIQAAFADLRDFLELPARGRHARSDGPPGGSGASAADALDRAAAEAQACARWYRDTPEWQRIGTVGRAARDLITAIREAAGDYWAEIRLDARVRGFARTLAARTALAVSGPAYVLAGRLERAGHRDTRIWRSAWGLHQATTTFANRVMRYTPPGSPDRMREARRIIDDLGQRQNLPGQPGPGRHAAPRGTGGAPTPNAAALASASFPVTVTRANAGQATAAPAARTAGFSPRQQNAGKRQ